MFKSNFHRLKKIAIGLVGFCLFWIFLQAVTIFWATRGMDYSLGSFQQQNEHPTLKIIFLGDSTAVGVGSQSPQTSTAGWFAKDFPEALIDNISQSGLRLAGLHNKLKEIKRDDYDLAVLQIGANDIMRLTPLTSIDREVRSILAFLKNKARTIVILHSGDVGTATIFIWPFNRILSQRSYQVREIYKKATRDFGASYVDLIQYNSDRLFIDDQKKYYAPDHLHLSGDGYFIWYQAIRFTLKQNAPSALDIFG